ncbi:MAG: hypothetical protein KAW12_17055 [Candidatus Aminicenantes bacterium]|nr:hypothetical protein [Candidatus Aminicenantes bacterium]
MESALENTITKEAVEKYVSRVIESRLQKAMEEFVERNDIRLKELSLIERIVRVEEELKALRESSDVQFASLQREMNARFEAMNTRFEAMDSRFVSINDRFESMQREINARFSATQWMIGIFVGIPAFIFAFFKVLEFMK